MTDVFRDWTYAEYCRAPLENLTAFNEERLTKSPAEGGLGYQLAELNGVFSSLVAYGGLNDIGVKAGQTVIVAPASGPFGGAAVLVALAMGARVIAMGRNKDSLSALAKRVPCPERLSTVPITGDMEADLASLQSHGQIDAYFDIGLPEASKSTHIKSATLSLRHEAHISFMGGYRDDIPIPRMDIMHKNKRIFGKWMYERSDREELFKLVEAGLLKLGKIGGCEVGGVYGLDEWREAFDKAAEVEVEKTFC
jgi:threonine dehydrogenase-like Zn-dependent dehydrogenase